MNVDEISPLPSKVPCAFPMDSAPQTKLDVSCACWQTKTLKLYVNNRAVGACGNRYRIGIMV